MSLEDQPISPEVVTIKGLNIPVDSDGYVFTSDFATQLLRKQNKSVASLLDKEDSGEYFLGEGLRVKGDAGNYSDMKIYKDDVEEFLRRHEEVYGAR